MSEVIGQQPTEMDAEAITVLAESHFKGFTTKSNFARKHADVVAMLASCQLISTQVHGSTWSNYWKITADGLAFMQGALDEVFNEE